MKHQKYRFARRTKRMRASIIREILKISSKPGIISFAGGLPAPSTFPLKKFEKAIIEALRQDGTKALQYMVTEGLAPLKQLLCNWIQKQGIHTQPEQMLLTHGSQQALELLGKIFLNPGNSVLVENPTYLGAIQSFNTFECKYVTVPMDSEGMRPEELERALKRHPQVRFIYVVPTFQNPAGSTMSLERRKALIKIAHKRHIPILEDDPYGLLRYKGKPLPSIYELAKGKGVVYMSTFSKLLSPGIRLGYVVADQSIINHLVLAKQPTDLQTNTLIQYAAYHYCKRGYLEEHIPLIIKDYAHRAGVMSEAIHRHFPPEVTFVEPEGGMFFWCTLPKHIRASDLFKKAIKEGVAFVDGSVFFANGGGENTMRLNFTNCTDDMIRIGIERLGKVIEGELRRSDRR
ncbi:MAG: 2-aminoadipate transaminase [Elusimicrobia bacterium]|nr:2-aminoadipate transaminase [Elusimicrobiota bacterium]